MSKIVDVAIYIDGMHHLSTSPKRIRFLEELPRVVKKGGMISIKVWGLEQEEDGSDAFVPQPRYLDKVEAKSNSKRAITRCEINDDLTLLELLLDLSVLTTVQYYISTSTTVLIGTSHNNFLRHRRHAHCRSTGKIILNLLHYICVIAVPKGNENICFTWMTPAVRDVRVLNYAPTV